MFKRLTTKNFQSHEDTTLDFHTGVNVIIGQSQSGKTSCTIRPLNLLINNRPLGGRYLSNFCGKADTTSIHLILDDSNGIKLSKEIVRDKDGKKRVKSAEYKIDGGEVYSGVDKQVPDKVTALLNLSEINIQAQHDKPFMITDSPGEVARIINRITRLDEADGWVSDLTKRVNQSNRDIKRLESELESTNIELKKYDNLDTVEVLVDKVEKLGNKIKELETEQHELASILDAIEDTTIEKQILNEKLKAKEYIDEADMVSSELSLLCVEGDLIEDFLNQDYELYQLEELEKKLSELVSEADMIEERIDTFYEEQEDISNFISIDKLIIDMVTKKDVITNTFSAMMKEIGKCPVCFSTINEAAIARVLENI